MLLINKKVEIVTSSIKRLSSMSRPSAESAQKSLSKYYSNVVHTFIDTEEQLMELVARAPDLVFLCMKKVPRNQPLNNSQDYIWITDVLDCHKIPYTGSDSQAHKLDEDKSKAKRKIKQANLPTAKSFLAFPGQYTSASQLPITFPLFVKPPTLGGGTGIDNQSIVYDFKSFEAKVQSLDQSFSSIALVEEYLEGREFTVAVIKDISSGAYRALPCELVAPVNEIGARILSQEVKNASTEHQLPIEDADLRERLSSLALEIFTALGASDYGRIDLRMNSAGELQFLEANLIPSLLKDYGNFPRLCESQLGLSYDTMLMHIVQLGLRRHNPEYKISHAIAAFPAMLTTSQYIEA